MFAFYVLSRKNKIGIYIIKCVKLVFLAVRKKYVNKIYKLTYLPIYFSKDRYSKLQMFLLICTYDSQPIIRSYFLFLSMCIIELL